MGVEVDPEEGHAGPREEQVRGQRGSLGQAAEAPGQHPPEHRNRDREQSGGPGQRPVGLVVEPVCAGAELPGQEPPDAGSGDA